MTPNVRDEDWPRGWRGHERDQWRRFRALSIDLKLDQLEEMHRLVLELQAVRERRREGRATRP